MQRVARGNLNNALHSSRIESLGSEAHGSDPHRSNAVYGQPRSDSSSGTSALQRDVPHTEPRAGTVRTSAPLRVLVLHDTVFPSPAIAALLAASTGVEARARGTDALRSIGAAPTLDAQRQAAIATATADVVVVALSEEVARLNDPALSLGIETLSDVGVPVVLLLGFGDEHTTEFARAGEWVRRRVRAILSIDATPAELFAAIHAASVGLVVIEPRIAAAMVQALSQALASSRRRTTAPDALTPHGAGTSLPLSAREREVLALLAAGHATKNIAHLLGISSHTVKAHVESIFEKFGATTRAEAVAIGVRRGAVTL